MTNFNPFKAEADAYSKLNKEKSHDPLDVHELLTESTNKAVITPEGELKLKKAQGRNKSGVELMKERYWGSHFNSAFTRQIAIEHRAMKDKFPFFELRCADKALGKHGWQFVQKGQKFWIGKLRTHSGCEYIVAAVYPFDYPFTEIYSYILEPYIPATEHRFKDGHLCLYDHDGTGQGYDKGKTTAVTIIAWTSAWLHAYEIWRLTGKWPILENNHGK